MIIIIIIMIINSNWTEWSTIQGVIGRVISNWPSAKRKVDLKLRAGRFEITSSITPWIVRNDVQLLINCNYNKIREEYDSGINYLTAWSFELNAEKEPIQVQLAQAWWRILSNYSGMTRTSVQLKEHDECNCTITAQIRAAEDQSDSRILI